MSEKQNMKAIVKTKEMEGAEYLEVKVPDISPEEVLVKVKASAICGTDNHIYEWNNWAQENCGQLPRIMGHEFSGIIEKVGKNVTKVKPGDRIAGETHVPCGNCFLCRTGNQYNCQNLKQFKNGVFADYAIIPEYCAEKIPENIPFEVGALFEPFGVAVHAASYVKLVGDSVMIIGAGPIGLFSIMMAKVMGASSIYVSEPNEYRRKLAEKLGINKAFNPLKENVVEQIKELTNGLGVGVVFETSGNIRAIKIGFNLLRKCGSYLMIGLPSEPLVLNAGSDIVWKGAKIYGVYGRDIFSTWEIVKNILGSKKVDLSLIITHHFSFKEFDKAFKLSLDGNAGKIILLPE